MNEIKLVLLLNIYRILKRTITEILFLGDLTI